MRGSVAKKFNPQNMNLIISVSRHMMNLTQTELSKAAKINQSNLCKIERGEKGTTVEDFCALMDALGYDILLRKRKKDCIARPIE